MTAEWADQPKPALDNQGIPGKTLGAQREALGWTVEQVADQLKLAVRQVIALEEGDYANLPGPAVVRGFVRAYAKILKLDPAPLVAQIALDTPVADATGATVRRDHKPTSFSQSRYPSNGKRKSKLPMLMGLVAVVAIAGAGVAAWQMKLIPASLMGGAPGTVPAASTDADASMLPAPVDASVANLPATVDGAAVPTDPSKAALPPVISNPVPLISVPPPVQPADGSAPVTAAVPAATPAVAAVPPAAVPPAGAVSTGALVITVRQDSWVEVRPASGKALFSRLVKAGQIETVTVNGPVTLVVGNPSGVDATLRGTPIAMPATSAGKVARIPLK